MGLEVHKLNLDLPRTYPTMDMTANERVKLVRRSNQTSDEGDLSSKSLARSSPWVNSRLCSNTWKRESIKRNQKNNEFLSQIFPSIPTFEERPHMLKKFMRSIRGHTLITLAQKGTWLVSPMLTKGQ